MNKFRNRKRAVLATAFFAISSFALAPVMLRDHAGIAAAFEQIKPALTEPSTQLAAPHFRLTPPEPDYTQPALPLREEADGQQPSVEFALASHGTSVTGSTSLWLDHAAFASSRSYGRGSGRAQVAASSGGSPSAERRQTFAPQDRDTDHEQDATAPSAEGTPATDDDAGNTGLADNDIPGTDDLHNPIDDPGNKDSKTNTPAAQVTEPSALLLMAAGIAGLALCRRRSQAA